MHNSLHVFDNQWGENSSLNYMQYNCRKKISTGRNQADPDNRRSG